MKAHYLGHVVFYVKDLERSLAFYRDLLGFKEVGRIFNGAAAALTSGRTHHELLLIQVGDAPAPSPGRRRGLYHIGIKVGDSLDELRQAKRELEHAGTETKSSSMLTRMNRSGRTIRQQSCHRSSRCTYKGVSVLSHSRHFLYAPL
jgi:catechol 2,3-dioxygenase